MRLASFDLIVHPTCVCFCLFIDVVNMILWQSGGLVSEKELAWNKVTDEMVTSWVKANNRLVNRGDGKAAGYLATNAGYLDLVEYAVDSQHVYSDGIVLLLPNGRMALMTVRLRVRGRFSRDWLVPFAAMPKFGPAPHSIDVYQLVDSIAPSLSKPRPPTQLPPEYSQGYTVTDAGTAAGKHELRKTARFAKAAALYGTPEQQRIVNDKLALCHFARELAKRCHVCHKQADDIKKCACCKSVWYCSRDCQRSHWSEHEATCKPWVPNAAS